MKRVAKNAIIEYKCKDFSYQVSSEIENKRLEKHLNIAVNNFLESIKTLSNHQPKLLEIALKMIENKIKNE